MIESLWCPRCGIGAESNGLCLLCALKDRLAAAERERDVAAHREQDAGRTGDGTK